MRRRALELAPDAAARVLLGCRLIANGVTVRVDDVEAYGGADDPASHAYRGERIANRSMFGGPGLLYVYVSHGIHSCANVVCGGPGEPAAVLLRGAQVLEGLDLAARRRGRELPGGRLDGPGRLCQGLGISRHDDGVDLFDPSSPVRLAKGTLRPTEHVETGPRVGLTRETERPWRFRVVVLGRSPRATRAASAR